MKIIYCKDGKQFTIDFFAADKYKLWISREDGESGQFDADALGDALFDAVEKFFSDNY